MADKPVDETISEDMIDKTLADSFPASDPPSWTLGRDREKRSGRTREEKNAGVAPGKDASADQDETV